MSEFQWNCRVGLSTGPVIGSVVGVQKYVYDIFGPGVNLAARIESQCGQMEIFLCEQTRDLIQSEFRTTDQGEFDIRGFGKQHIYQLDGPYTPANDGLRH